MPTPRSKAQLGLRRGRAGMPERDHDAARVQGVDQLERAGQLRRERDVADGPGREQALGQREVGGAEVLDRMDAGMLGREKRAFEVRRRAGGARSARRAPPRSAAASSVLAAEMNVGWNAVTPVSSIAAPAMR